MEQITLSRSERAALEQINDFAKVRGYRYGLNELHVRESRSLPALLEKGLAFYKKAHGYRYWLPTKKGRQLLEDLQKRELEEWSVSQLPSDLREEFEAEAQLETSDPELERQARMEMEAEKRLEWQAEMEAKKMASWWEEEEQKRSEEEPWQPEPASEPKEESGKRKRSKSEDYDQEAIDEDYEAMKYYEERAELGYIGEENEPYYDPWDFEEGEE